MYALCHSTHDTTSRRGNLDIEFELDMHSNIDKTNKTTIRKIKKVHYVVTSKTH